jgi:hypothetical protein
MAFLCFSINILKKFEIMQGFFDDILSYIHSIENNELIFFCNESIHCSLDVL